MKHKKVESGQKRQFCEFNDELDMTAPSENSKKCCKNIVFQKKFKKLSFPLFEDKNIGLGRLNLVPDHEFDQDVDTDEEALQGSKSHMQKSFESAIREFEAMPLQLSYKMLKNSEVVQRVARPEEYSIFDATSKI